MKPENEVRIANGVAKLGDYVIYQRDPLYPDTQPHPITRICVNGEVWTSGGKGYAKYFERVTQEQIMKYAFTRTM